jgi:ABC-type transport system substrate-binding protein
MRRVAWLLVGSIGAWGCGVPPEEARARPAPELSVAVQGDITGVYPTLRNESFSFAVNANVFEGLTSLGPDLAPHPALADAWENPDEHTWIFHLRPGMRFSDTQPVRVQDVVASLRFAMAADATRTLLAPRSRASPSSRCASGRAFPLRYCPPTSRSPTCSRRALSPVMRSRRHPEPALSGWRDGGPAASSSS